MAKAVKETTVEILKLNTGNIHVAVLGTTPIILNRMSEKSRRQLLLPSKKNMAERASTLKHNPLEEYRASPYIDPREDGETYLQFLSTSFKQAMAGAALDVPGITKAQIERLVWVNEERIALFGIPKLFMSVTRSADMNRTPDIRTRAIIAEWACYLSISYRDPILREQGIMNLLGAAGTTPGVGDWRVGKGSGNYGQFQLVNGTDPTFKKIVETGGRAAQIKAMNEPESYDLETEELLAWFQAETVKRGFRTNGVVTHGEADDDTETEAQA